MSGYHDADRFTHRGQTHAERLSGISRFVVPLPTQDPTVAVPIPPEPELESLLACAWKKSAVTATWRDSFLQHLEGTVSENCEQIATHVDTWLYLAHDYTHHVSDPNFHKFYDFLDELGIHNTEVALNRGREFLKDHPSKAQIIADKREYLNVNGVFPRSYKHNHGWTLLQTFVFFMLLYALILLCFSLSYSGPDAYVMLGVPRYARLDDTCDLDDPETIRQRDREARLQNAEQQAVQAAMLASFSEQADGGGDYGRSYGANDYGNSANYGGKYQAPQQSVKPKERTRVAHSYESKTAHADYPYQNSQNASQAQGNSPQAPKPPDFTDSLNSPPGSEVEIQYASMGDDEKESLLVQKPSSAGILDAVVAEHYSPRPT